MLDLRPALAATTWNHSASTLGNFLKVTDSGGNATLAIAPAGTGAGTAIATLRGAGSLGLSDLLSQHALRTIDAPTTLPAPGGARTAVATRIPDGTWCAIEERVLELPH